MIKAIIEKIKYNPVTEDLGIYYLQVFPKDYSEEEFVVWEKKSLVYTDTMISDFENEVIRTVKQKVSDLIRNYDTSVAVNSFKVNGIETWLDKATRVGLMNSVTTLKALNKETMTLWLNDVPYTIGVDDLQQVLIALENYAIDCYNQTCVHLATVSSLSDPYEIESYDYTQGYPDKLEFIV